MFTRGDPGLRVWMAPAAFLCLGGWFAGSALTYVDPGDREVRDAAADVISEATVQSATESAFETASGLPGAFQQRGDAGRVDTGWASAASSNTGIPLRALVGYAGAELAMNAEAPECHLGWTTLAALGNIESGHGTHDGSDIDEAGVARPAILGPELDGGEFDRVIDTDAGALDGSAAIDRAVGPLQFIPSTWQRWGADGSGDGVADPQQIDDAALAAARYICSYGDLADPQSWRRAIFAYNHVESYVNAVAESANVYAARAQG
jgi:Transglycosylase SLT domain